MIWTSTKRVIRTGFVNFWRNGFVSLASILVMIIALFVIGSLIFTSAILSSSLDQIRSKVDINVYFIGSAKEGDILNIKKSVEALPQVKTVEYVSRDQALANFKARHANDQLTLQALEELNDNPLGAVINIKAKDPSQYEAIATYLSGDAILSQEGSPIVDKINYAQNKVAIEKLSKILDSGRKLGLIITLVLALIAVIITFNTIRLAIYVSREEIGVMRLVGASTPYIRGPFVIIGIMYGLLSGLFTLALFYPVTFWLGRSTENFFTGINVFNYYISNFIQISLIIVGAGVVIGALSSYLAVRKYLKV